MRIRSIFFNLFALIVGGAVGASAALLYAPQSGRTTRTMIRTRGVMLQEKVAEDVNLARLRIEKRVGNAAQGARHKVVELGNQLNVAVESIPMALRSNGH